MPSFLDYSLATAPFALNSLLNRRSIGSATNAVTAGVGNAQNQIAQTGAQIGQQFAPFQVLGTSNINQLNAGLQPGGGLADPFTQNFNFTGQDLQNEPGYQFGLDQGNQALLAAQKALGTRFSGAAVKRGIQYNQDYAGTKFNDAFNRDLTTYNTNQNTFRQNQTDRYNRLMGVVNTGLQATDQNANAQLITGQQLAQLETERANAIAAGDLGKADSLQQAIEGATNAIQGVRTVGSLLGGGAGAASAAGVIPDISGALPAAAGAFSALPSATMPSLAAIQAGAVPEIASSAIGLGSLPAGPGLIGTGGAAGAASSGGLGSAITGFLTNPVTIAAGAALAGALIWKSRQVHPTADKWVQGYQKQFDQHMGQINDAFFQAVQSGQLTRAQAQQIRDQAAGFAADYEKMRAQFATKGRKEGIVAGQALNTLNQWYGPNFSKYLGAMDQAIASLPA